MKDRGGRPRPAPPNPRVREDACPIDTASRDSRRLATPALVVFLELVRGKPGPDGGHGRRPGPAASPREDPTRPARSSNCRCQQGIDKFKAATFAECEMLAQAGARDVLLAYHLVGRNIERAVRFVQAFPEVRFMVIADHPVTGGIPVHGEWPRAGQRSGSPARPGYRPAAHRASGRQPCPPALRADRRKARGCGRGDSTFTTATCAILHWRNVRPL